MNCPSCGVKALVFLTRHDEAANETYRKLRCKECGNKFYTYEFEVDSNTREFKKFWKSINRQYGRRGESKNDD